jgi:hypothetical protein
MPKPDRKNARGRRKLDRHLATEVYTTWLVRLKMAGATPQVMERFNIVTGNWRERLRKLPELKRSTLNWEAGEFSWSKVGTSTGRIIQSGPPVQKWPDIGEVYV